MNPKLWIALCTVTILVTGCVLPASVDPTVEVGPEAWIDAPLPDSNLPLAPYTVISHGTSPTGIASFELSINGQIYSTDLVDPAQASQTLANQSQPWNPPAPGTYLISVRALDNSGVWGLSAEVRVTVGDSASATPEATEERPTDEAIRPTDEPIRPTDQPTSVPTVVTATNAPPQPTTVPPTATPTAPPPTATPTAPPADTSGPSIGTPSVQPNPNGLPAICGTVPPTVVTVQVTDPSGVQAVFLHVTYRNQEQVIGMTDADGDTFLTGEWHVPQDANGGDATFFIEAIDMLGNVSTGGQGTINLSRTVCP